MGVKLLCHLGLLQHPMGVKAASCVNHIGPKCLGKVQQVLTGLTAS